MTKFQTEIKRIDQWIFCNPTANDFQFDEISFVLIIIDISEEKKTNLNTRKENFLSHTVWFLYFVRHGLTNNMFDCRSVYNSERGAFDFTFRSRHLYVYLYINFFSPTFHLYRLMFSKQDNILSNSLIFAFGK